METIDKKRLFTALKRRFWVIAVAAVGLALIFFGVTKLFVKPEYTATTKLYVNNSESDIFGASALLSHAGTLEEEILLQAYEYVVLGDNFDESIDSRDSRVGVITEADIYGRISFPVVKPQK